MPRRSGVPKREVLPDPVYGSQVVTKLINQIMLDGKKGTAQTIVYGAFDIASKKLGAEAIDIFNKALENIMPSRFDLSGSYGNPSRAQTNPRHPLDGAICA